MADDAENDDKWLYGDHSEILPQETAEKAVEESQEKQDEEEKKDQENENSQNNADQTDAEHTEQSTEEEAAKDNGEVEKQNGEEGSEKEEGDYDEDSDDDVNVVIGDIKTSPAYTSLNIKRGGLLTSTTKGDKIPQAPQTGKFSVEEFDQPGMINGVPAVEYNLDSLEDKPWRKPGADITDYFNYGFNEDTWRAYCERQKRMRLNESGSGLVPLNSIGMPRGPVPILNDNSKYSGNYTGIRKAGPPPGRRMTGAIDVIGGAATRVPGTLGKTEPPKENVIQVMTADRREYSRKPGFPDLTVPPPSGNFEEFQPEFGFNPEPEPFYGGYEPTQDCQWGTEPNPAWQPTEIKALTPGPAPVVPAPIPPVNMGPPPFITVPPPTKEASPVRSHSREKTKERESNRREHEKSRDRERSHRRERSRSRSKRHKSRSRSPSRRSHKKKKSRRHEDSD
ncbi:pre-mRNA 3'-end-processing factor FIP1-like [Agrilus planipennis]|uniref:Pre-mRNA 3'-end-processing factor FIP1-like n=1 Tax=Agrilus planipennis TaxID=224129 RepID=A0A1W4X1L4_AGRPL|nr:pre-mRNA 3'-end-processing factor FIP1-like [Agrilus planipennis]XP_018330030.1 pre-mRNA 3'-end-processing factor FIP1-like [Agrilus planipennis]